MSHYVNNVGHHHTIYSTEKYGLADTGSYGTYIRPDNPHENPHKQGHTILFSSPYGSRIPSYTA